MQNMCNWNAPEYARVPDEQPACLNVISKGCALTHRCQSWEWLLAHTPRSTACILSSPCPSPLQRLEKWNNFTASLIHKSSKWDVQSLLGASGTAFVFLIGEEGFADHLSPLLSAITRNKKPGAVGTTVELRKRSRQSPRSWPQTLWLQGNRNSHMDSVITREGSLAG